MCGIDSKGRKSLILKKEGHLYLVKEEGVVLYFDPYLFEASNGMC